MVQSIDNNTQTSLQTVQQKGSSGNVSKNDFLKLLTIQLKQQNPLKPYDNQEFASQLAQFSQLEQLSDIRSLLEEQIQTNNILTQTITNSALPGMLGKNAKVSTNKLNYDGEKQVTLGFTLPYAVQSGEIKIYNQGGALVRTVQLGNSSLTNGEHKVEWDGTDSDGNTLGKGIYTFEVKLRDAKGVSSNADTFSTGNIEAVRFKQEGTFLVVNGLEIPLNNVFDISVGNI